MQNDKTFRTKSGICEVTDDKIILSRQGISGAASKILVGNGITRILVIYGIIAIFVSYLGITAIQQESYLNGVLMLILASLLILSILKSLNNSGTPEIEKKSIEKINFTRGASGFTRSRFEILFRNEKGKIKKRMILMPGSLNGEDEENEKALKIFRSEGLM